MFNSIWPIIVIRRRTQFYLNSEKSIEGVRYDLTIFLNLVVYKTTEISRGGIHEGLIINGELEILQIFHKPINVCSGMIDRSKIISSADESLQVAKE